MVLVILRSEVWAVNRSRGFAGILEQEVGAGGRNHVVPKRSIPGLLMPLHAERAESGFKRNRSSWVRTAVNADRNRKEAV